MKIIKIAAINILIFLLLLSFSEFLLFSDNKKRLPNVIYRIEKIPYKNSFLSRIFRPVSGENYKEKNPIVIFGCSYAYGEGLNFENTIGYKLSEYTKRTVYNYAVPGKGLQNALFILQNGLYDNNLKNPDYIIYVMISDHIRRIYSNVAIEDYIGQPIYVYNKNTGFMDLKYDYFPVYRQLYSFYFANNLIYKKFLQYDIKRNNKYVNAYFRTINKCIKEKFPDAKFVILLYGEKFYYNIDFSQLEKDGIMVTYTKELTGIDFNTRKYYLSDTDFHPTKEVWDIVVPAFSKKIGL